MNKKLNSKLRQRYINHLNMPNKQPIQEWENERRTIHNLIFKDIGLDRHSEDGKKFSKEFDRSIELELKSLTEIFCKRINGCETPEEMEEQKAKLEFIKKWSNK